jgi:hypothetical protein
MKLTDVKSNVEVSGNSLNSMLSGFGTFRSLAQRKIVDAGLVPRPSTPGTFTVDPTTWLPLRRVLDVFNEVGREIGGDVLLRVGRGVIDNAVFPPTINSVETCIESVQIAYRLNHRRNGKPYIEQEEKAIVDDIGYYAPQRLAGERRYRVVSRTVYPCRFDQGVLLGLAQKFEPRARVAHDDGPCRARDGEHCAYIITW